MRGHHGSEWSASVMSYHLDGGQSRRGFPTVKSLPSKRTPSYHLLHKRSIADGDGFGAPLQNTPLFEDLGLFEQHSTSNKRPAPPPSSAIDPTPCTPFLPLPPLLRLPLFSLPLVTSPLNLSTGTGRNLMPDASIPPRAPVQTRNYPTLSVTSRIDPLHKRRKVTPLLQWRPLAPK